MGVSGAILGVSLSAAFAWMLGAWVLLISFAKFKKLCNIHQYGRGQRRLFIIFVGQPKENLFAFYQPTCTRPEMLKIAYEYLVDTITTDMKQEFLDGNMQWGNCGIPLSYGDVRGMF
jgi:hypothetical protein